MTLTTAPWYWTYLRYCSNFKSERADNDSLPFVSCNSFDTFIVSSSILYYQSPNNGGQITNEAVWVASGACFLFFIMKSHCWKNCVYCHHPFVFFVFPSLKLKLCRSYEVNKKPSNLWAHNSVPYNSNLMTLDTSHIWSVLCIYMKFHHSNPTRFYDNE